VRRTRRRLAGAFPARRSLRHRSGAPSTHVEAAFTGPSPWAHRRLKKDVTVCRLVSKGTIEERILQRQRAKQSLADEGFFGDFRGREMAAGVQATGISDDWETERAYLNMEAR